MLSIVQKMIWTDYYQCLILWQNCPPWIAADDTEKIRSSNGLAIACQMVSFCPMRGLILIISIIMGIDKWCVMGKKEQTFTIQEIRRAFFEAFYGSGEVFSPYATTEISADECLEQTECWFGEFQKILDKRRYE